MTETVSTFHQVKTSAYFKGVLERTRYYLFISAPSHRYVGVEVLNMISITRLSALCAVLQRLCYSGSNVFKTDIKGENFSLFKVFASTFAYIGNLVEG